MNKFNLKLHLFMVVLILATLPLLVSYFFLGDVIDSALSMGINSEMEAILANYQDDLKEFNTYDPEKGAKYKARFMDVENARTIYRNPGLIVSTLKSTYMSYFYIGFLMVLFFSIASAWALGNRITRSYNALFKLSLKKSNRLKELEHVSEWQSVAGYLAHEIKNPLTPIELTISSLEKWRKNLSEKEFEMKLNETQELVVGEVNKLKRLVNQFSDFSHLPNANLEPTVFWEFIEGFVCHYQAFWPSLKIIIDETSQVDTSIQSVVVSLDKDLFTRVLVNILNNAAEINSGDIITASMQLRVESGFFYLKIINTGKMIPDEERQKIFRMYYSSNSTSENRGLGLFMVKKIMLEHGGDVNCLFMLSGAGFELVFPLNVEDPLV